MFKRPAVFSRPEAPIRLASLELLVILEPETVTFPSGPTAASSSIASSSSELLTLIPVRVFCELVMLVLDRVLGLAVLVVPLVVDRVGPLAVVVVVLLVFDKVWELTVVLVFVVVVVLLVSVVAAVFVLVVLVVVESVAGGGGSSKAGALPNG